MKPGKIQTMALLLILLLGLCACAPQTPETTATPGEDSQATQQPTADVTETVTEAPTESAYPLPDWSFAFDQESDNLEYTYGLEDYFVPFWKRNIIKNECLCFVQEGDVIQAKILLRPEKILCVRDWSLKKEYVEGKDYLYDSETNTLRWIEGSSVPYFTQNWLSGRYDDGTEMPGFAGYDQHPWSDLGYARWGNAIYCIGPALYEKQMFITYTYNPEDFQAPVSTYQGDKLPNFMEKVTKGETVRVVFYGDSIPVGCDVSSMYNRDPQQPDYPSIFKRAIKAIYHSTVKLTNTAVGGTTSAWGVENLEERLLRHKPDLAIILFGGNDDGIGAAAATKKNMAKMIERIQTELPQTDIIIMSSFKGNEAGGFNTPNLKPLLTQYFNELAEKYERVVSIDLYDIHEYMLQTKNYIDFSGNGINHPNDYLIRIIAQQLLSTVVDFDALRAR